VAGRKRPIGEKRTALTLEQKAAVVRFHRGSRPPPTQGECRQFVSDTFRLSVSQGYMSGLLKAGDEVLEEFIRIEEGRRRAALAAGGGRWRPAGEKRTALTLEQKAAVINFHRGTAPPPKQLDCRQFIADTFGLSVSQGYISGLLKKGDAVLEEYDAAVAAAGGGDDALSKKRRYTSPVADLEERLWLWFRSAEAPVRDARLLEKAREIGAEINLQMDPKKFNYSENWLLSWKKRFGIARAPRGRQAGGQRQLASRGTQTDS